MHTAAVCHSTPLGSSSTHTKPPPVTTHRYLVRTEMESCCPLIASLCSISLYLRAASSPDLQGRSLCKWNNPLFCLHSSKQSRNILQRAAQATSAAERGHPAAAHWPRCCGSLSHVGCSLSKQRTRAAPDRALLCSQREFNSRQLLVSLERTGRAHLHPLSKEPLVCFFPINKMQVVGRRWQKSSGCEV